MYVFLPLSYILIVSGGYRLYIANKEENVKYLKLYILYTLQHKKRHYSSSVLNFYSFNEIKFKIQ